VELVIEYLLVSEEDVQISESRFSLRLSSDSENPIAEKTEYGFSLKTMLQLLLHPKGNYEGRRFAVLLQKKPLSAGHGLQEPLAQLFKL
jgi:hypothetical protein